MNKREGTTVRLTPQAHLLLSDKADDYSMDKHKISMKDIASEAIFLLVRGEDTLKEVEAYRKELNERSIKLQRGLPFCRLISVAVGTVAGIILGKVL